MLGQKIQDLFPVRGLPPACDLVTQHVLYTCGAAPPNSHPRLCVDAFSPKNVKMRPRPDVFHRTGAIGKAVWAASVVTEQAGDLET